MKVSKVKEMTAGNAKQVLVVSDEDPPRYFVVSTVVPFDTGKMETLVFNADADGTVTSYAGVCGGTGMTRAQAITELESDEDVDTLDRFVETMGGPMEALFSMMKRSVLNQPVSAEPDPQDTE